MGAYVMHVRFERVADSPVCLVTAWAHDRRPFEISRMGGVTRLPHDLATFAVESALRLPGGFFNLTAHGATFRSGGRRMTRPGRALILVNRAALDDTEAAVNHHIDAWRQGAETPAAAALDDAERRWRSLGEGEHFDLEWHRLPLPSAAARRPEVAGVRRRPR
jgi:hypothetical protein